MSELQRRLRNIDWEHSKDHVALCREAADALDAQTAEIARLREQLRLADVDQAIAEADCGVLRARLAGAKKEAARMRSDIYGELTDGLAREARPPKVRYDANGAASISSRDAANNVLAGKYDPLASKSHDEARTAQRRPTFAEALGVEVATWFGQPPGYVTWERLGGMIDRARAASGQ